LRGYKQELKKLSKKGAVWIRFRHHGEREVQQDKEQKKRPPSESKWKNKFKHTVTEFATLRETPQDSLSTTQVETERIV